LLDAGIPIVGDKRPGLMHDKFMVIDRSEVWMGSMNFTDSGTYDDNNNMMRIRSTKMAENYSKEFEEMFVDNKFGPDSVPETPNPTLTIDGTEVDTYFSPDDGVLNALVPLLNSAQESIYFLAFSFTSNELGDIVREKAKAGLTVEGVMNPRRMLSKQARRMNHFRRRKRRNERMAMRNSCIIKSLSLMERSLHLDPIIFRRAPKRIMMRT